VDCKSNQFFKIRILDKDMLEIMAGKMRKAGNGLVEISEDDTGLIGKNVEIRSPLHCKAADGICATCYNPSFVERLNLTQNAGIGLLSSTSMATVLTNLTLKAAHSGLSLDRSEVDLTNDISIYSE
jgi:hypothetical protein